MKPIFGAGLFLLVLVAVLYGIRLYAFQQLDMPHPFTPAKDARSVALFEPSSPAIVSAMMNLAGVGKSDVVYDLGCGDGRVVIAAALAGARAVGVDIDADLIRQGRINAERAHVSGNVQFLHQDLFATPLGNATVVMLYLTPAANLMLRPKLLSQLKPGTRIVSHSHGMGEWKPDRESLVEDHRIYAWTVPADVDGTWKLDVMDKYADSDYSLRITQRFQSVEIAFNAGQKRVAVVQPQLAGSTIEFTVQEGIGALTPGARFKGQVEGDAISGKFQSGSNTGSWTARRIKNKDGK